MAAKKNDETKAETKAEAPKMSAVEKARAAKARKYEPSVSGVLNVPPGKTARTINLAISEARQNNLRAQYADLGFEKVPQEDWGSMRPSYLRRCEIWLADEEVEVVFQADRLANREVMDRRRKGEKDPDRNAIRAQKERDLETLRLKAVLDSNPDARERLKRDFL